MKVIIFALLFVCYYTSYTEGQSFTREKCSECCNAFTEPVENQHCNEKCEVKFASPQNFKSEKQCKKSCDIIPGIVCAAYCYKACEKDFEGKNSNWLVSLKDWI